MNAAYSRLGLVRDARSKLNSMIRQRDAEATWVLIVASEYFEHYQLVDALSEQSMLQRSSTGGRSTGACIGALRSRR
jgi:hypothetical protein